MKNYLDRKISFIDAKNVKCTVYIEIADGRLSMSGDYGNSYGQIVDNIKPKTNAQQELVDIWNEWHLNDMHSGTEKQEEALYKHFGNKNVDYVEQCEYLKSIDLYEDNGYKYGTSWLVRELPEDIVDTLENIIEELIEENNEMALVDLYNYDKTQIYHAIKNTELFDEEQIPIVMLFCFEEKLSLEGLNCIEINGDYYNVYGTTYLAGDDETMDYYWEEELKSYLEECVYSDLPKDMIKYFNEEKWIQDAKFDERGNALNHYDGSEIEFEFNDKFYYAYHQ